MTNAAGFVVQPACGSARSLVHASLGKTHIAASPGVGATRGAAQGPSSSEGSKITEVVSLAEVGVTRSTDARNIQVELRP